VLFLGIYYSYNMAGKILIAVIIVLLILILGEAGYLLYRANNQKITVSDVSKHKNPVRFPISASPTNSQSAPNPRLASPINQEQLFWFTKTNTIAHVSSKIEQKYEGKIFEINAGNFDDQGNISTVYELFLSDDQITDKSRMNSFLITEQIIKIASFTDSQSNTPLTITDLKKGDHVIIELVIDLTKPMGFGFEQFKITKL